MKAKINPSIKNIFLIFSFCFVAVFLLISFQSCQRDESYIDNEFVMLKSAGLTNPTLFWGHELFYAKKGKAAEEIRTIGGSDLSYFEESFVLNVNSGNGSPNLAADATITIDGIKVVEPKDFKRNNLTVSKEISGLTPTSQMVIKVNGKSGNFIDVWIEGTLKPNFIKDFRDGAIYKTVSIGTQVWMAENLKATNYTDGTSIPNVNDGSQWAGLTTGAYCWYNNDISKKDVFGALYNWYTVNTEKLCPAGWHVPNNDEWIVLEGYLIANGYNYDGSVEGNKIGKAMASRNFWQLSIEEGSVGNNLLANNKSGFSCLPGGLRLINFYDIGEFGYWWSSTEYSSINAWNLRLGYINKGPMQVSAPKFLGLSVRCVKN